MWDAEINVPVSVQTQTAVDHVNNILFQNELNFANWGGEMGSGELSAEGVVSHTHTLLALSLNDRQPGDDYGKVWIGRNYSI